MLAGLCSGRENTAENLADAFLFIEPSWSVVYSQMRRREIVVRITEFRWGALSAGKRAVALGLIAIVALIQPGFISSYAFAQETGALRIALVEGSNRVVRKNDDLRLVVEVRNGMKAPVAGAEVTFIAPESGAGVLFAGNTNRLTIRTDSAGRADARSTRSIGDGPFLVAIAANYQGQTTTTSAPAVNQTPGSTPSTQKKKSGMLKWILIGAGAGAAVGILLATKNGSDSDSPTSEPPTITVGPPTVGAP